MGEETDFEFVKSFTPVRFQKFNLWGRSGKVDLAIFDFYRNTIEKSIFANIC